MDMPGNEKSAAEIAKDILEAILDLMGTSASVELSEEVSIEGGDRETSSVVLDILGEDPGILIGRRGQTLASLQYIVRLIVGQQAQISLPLIIDVEGYKRRRWEALRALAGRMAEQVQAKGEPLALEPMSAFERRVIHLALSGHPAVATESTGYGEERKVVILPKEQLA